MVTEVRRDEPAVLMPKAPVAPPRPTKLSLWMHKFGRPNRLTVEYRATGPDTAETIIVLAIMRDGKVTRTLEVSPGDLLPDRYGSLPGEDARLVLDHAHVVDWTAGGRARLDEWVVWGKRESGDLADYRRLYAKFGGIAPPVAADAHSGP